MKRFIEGVDRHQTTLFPDRLEDFIAEDNPARVVDIFVDALDLGELGFGRVEPEVTGRPGYHPSILLKLYIYGYLNREKGLTLRRYWTNVCQSCAIRHLCTTDKERRITRWEHEHVLETVQRRLDKHPEKMRQRRETVEHPFCTIKSWMGYTHSQTKTLKRVATEMALHVLAYNIKRGINIMGIGALIGALRAA